MSTDAISTLAVGLYWQENRSHSEAREVGKRGLASGVKREPMGETKLQVSWIQFMLLCTAASVMLRTQSGSSKWLPSLHHGNLKRQLQPRKAASAGQSESDGPTDTAPNCTVRNSQALVVIKNARQPWGVLSELQLPHSSSLSASAPEQSRLSCWSELD